MQRSEKSEHDVIFIQNSSFHSIKHRICIHTFFPLNLTLFCPKIRWAHCLTLSLQQQLQSIIFHHQIDNDAFLFSSTKCLQHIPIIHRFLDILNRLLLLNGYLMIGFCSTETFLIIVRSVLINVAWKYSRFMVLVKAKTKNLLRSFHDSKF